jgi:hypothetical protein
MSRKKWTVSHGPEFDTAAHGHDNPFHNRLKKSHIFRRSPQSTSVFLSIFISQTLVQYTEVAFWFVGHSVFEYPGCEKQCLSI